MDQKKLYKMCLIGLLLVIGLGYAYMHSDLSINGDALFKHSTFNIHWMTPTVSAGSVSGTNVTTAAHVVGTSQDTVEYSITLPNPRDYYEFTVPAKNDGTIDGMISNITNKVYNSSDVEITKPGYVKYDIRYENGAKVEEKQLLRANQSINYKVKVYYSDDVDPSLLPNTDTTLSFKFKVTYVQADNTATDVVAPGFNDDTSWEDLIEGIREGYITPTVGDTKEVDMGALGTHTLRIANTSTPSECSTTGFSETACGLVIEFSDIIGSHSMNDTNTNVGGWRDCSMRTYLNSDVYNTLPTPLKNAIIDTTVVSGHGSTAGEENFTTTDKLYLLSPMELWGYNGFSMYDTARDYSRQFDYYEDLGVDNNNYTEAIKKYNGSSSYWFLRAPYSTYTDRYRGVNASGQSNYNDAINSRGVSPAFRIA